MVPVEQGSAEVGGAQDSPSGVNETVIMCVESNKKSEKSRSYTTGQRDYDITEKGWKQSSKDYDNVSGTFQSFFI